MLDTNALSEPGRPSPDPGFMKWYLATDDLELWISAVSIGELRRGLVQMVDGTRRKVVQSLYTNIVNRFSAQVLPIDAAVAEAWGELSARLKQSGHVIGTPDEMIASTALAHNLTLVSRNRRHFDACGCQVHQPWSG